MSWSTILAVTSLCVAISSFAVTLARLAERKKAEYVLSVIAMIAVAAAMLVILPLYLALKE